MISLAAIGIELKVRSNKGLTKKVTNHLYIYFSRRNLVDKIICVRGNNAIDLIVGLLVALKVILVICIFLNCGLNIQKRKSNSSVDQIKRLQIRMSLWVFKPLLY